MINTLKLIIINEWRSMWYEKVPLMVLALLLGFMAIAIQATSEQTQRRTLALQQANQQSQTDWLNQPNRHPHRVGHYGDFVAKPLHPLSAITPGIINEAGSLVYLEAHRLNSANFNPASEATSLERFITITPDIIIQWVLPLGLIMAGYAMITREKIGGTLGYLIGNGTPLSWIIVGKFIALFIPAAIPLILLNGYIGYLMADSPQSMARIGLMLSGQLVYIAIWSLVITAVSLKAKLLNQALLSLLLIWVFICMIAPKSLANIAQTLYPTYPRAEAEYHAEQKLKSIGDSHNPNDPYFENFKQQTLKKYGVNRIEDLPLNYNGLVMQEGEKLTTQVYREQMNYHHQQLLKQNQWIRQWLWLSPALALEYIQMAASGADIHHHIDFINQAEQRRYKLIEYLNSVHTNHVNQQDDKNTRNDKQFWENAPRDPIALANLKLSQKQVTSAYLVLIAWLALLGLFIFWPLKKQ